MKEGGVLMEKVKPKKKEKHMMRNMIVLMIFISLGIWTYYVCNPNDDHSYQIEINQEELVFQDTDINLSPGDNISKPLIIKNTGNQLVYYQVYLANVRGNVQDVVIFQIYQDDQLIFSSKASQFNVENAFQPENAIKPGETHTYDLKVVISEEAGNEYENSVLNFDFITIINKEKN
jgi:hypothetical protein